MAMDIDPFSMLEVSLREDPDPDDRRHGSSAGVMHQVENDVQIVQPPPPFQYIGNDVLTPQRAVLNNIQKLALTSKEEEKFRRRAYSSISLVLRKRLHCTICDAHIGAYLGLKEMDIEHPLLKVLACSKCTLKYHYLEFPLNPDGRDIRCRWCTESSKEESPLRFCSYCPFAFCEMCIYRNLPLDELASNKNAWVCFVCNVKDLWPSRAVLWALRVLIDTNLALKEEKKWSTDQSSCCKNKAMKQRRQITQPLTIIQPVTSQNGHNQPPPLRPIVPTSVNNFRSALKNPIRPTQQRGVVRPILPITPTRAVPMSSQNSTTQLYDTAWLTEKVQSISTTLLNLNNNLHRIAQGIPEKENKYSIKSKMISMVSLLNISATQLQKASKEMEEESKKILDKNYKVAKVTPVSAPPPVSIPVIEPIKVEPKVVLKPIIEKVVPKNPTPRKRSFSSTSRNKRFKGSSEYDSEYDEDEEEEDFDDPDFLTKTRPEGEGPLTRLRTRACFVKLERLDLKSESNDGSEPQPSTSKAPDPFGTVGPEELKEITGDPKENGEYKEKESAEVKMETETDKDADVTSQATIEAADNSSQPGTEGASKDVSLSSDKEASQDVSQSADEEASKDVSQSADEEASKDVSQSADEEASKDVSHSTDGKTPKAIPQSVAEDAPQLGPDASSQASPKVPSSDASDDNSQPAEGSALAAPNDDSQPADDNESADTDDESHSAADDSQPAAEEDSSAKQDPKPAADIDHPNPGLNDMIASEPSPKPSDEAVNNPPSADVGDLNGTNDAPGDDPPGDDPLNESSATDSSITDSSTTSADTSDS